jgi:UDP-4-amino-4,6-dideoxy-N-acetyl-beta-L-altrosamine transaminase
MTRRTIPYGRQSIDDEDIAAVTRVLRGDWLTQGPAVPAFEAALGARFSVNHAVAVNSATSALHLACLALGVGPGDRVWTTPITFVASANCALYCGASVDFVDIDPITYNMSPTALERQLRQAAAQGCLPKVIIPVHLAGQPCEMAAISALARRHAVKIIEDASHAVGAEYLGEPVGNCRYSDITVLSFHPVKIITTCEGGAALTQDLGLAQQMALLRSHGITREPAEMDEPSHGPWYYQQLALGLNYRLSDLHAALGLSQMRRLDAFVERRRVLAARYDRLFAGLPVIRPWQHPEGDSSWHLYIVRLPETPGNASRSEVFTQLRENGIGVNLHYIPVHMQPYHRERRGSSAPALPESESYYAEAMSLPLYPDLTDDDQDWIVACLQQALAGVTP